MRKNFELREKTPEIPQKVLENIKFEALSQPLKDRHFSIENINYALRICRSKNDKDEVNGQPAEYYAQPNEWAIYIWEDLMEKIQRVLLFHEITECYFRKKFGMEKTPAHNASLPYEKQIKKELLSEDEERVLKELKNTYSAK